MAIEPSHTPEQAGSPHHGRRWTRLLPLSPRRSIRARLQLSHLVTSLLPMLLLGGALLYTTNRAERQIIEQSQLSVAHAIALDVSQIMGGIDSELLDLGRRLPSDADDLAPLQADLANYLRARFPDVLEIAFISPTGRELVRIDKNQIFSSTQQRDRRDEPFFEPARQGTIVHSVGTWDSGQPAITAAVPARDNVGRVKGVLVASISTQQIEQRLMSLPQNTIRSAFIIDEPGTILLGNAPDSIVQSGELRAWAATDEPTATLDGGGDQQITAARAAIEQQPTTWWLVVEQRTDVALFSLNRNTQLLGLVVIVTAGVVVVWGLMIAREMTRPIVRLHEGVREISAGQLGATIQTSRHDELGQLAHAFNRMSERLAATHDAVEQRNAQINEGLLLARLIQRDLQGKQLPSDAGISAYAISEPAIEIGGDFYAFYVLPDDRVRLVIGDVSGKGVAAALVMALATALVDVHATQDDSPAALLDRLNVELYQRLNPSRMSVALLVAEFEPRTRLLRVGNAGMIAPLIVGRSLLYLPCYGHPLGIVEHVVYTNVEYALGPDQIAVFLSDGILEARNADGDIWGFQRLEQAAGRAKHADAREFVSDIRRAVQAHIGSVAAADDMTIIAATLRSPRNEKEEYALRSPAKQIDSAADPSVYRM